MIEKIPDKCKDDINIPDIRLMRQIFFNISKAKIFIENIFKDEKIFKL